ncbi:unnamed protein product [Blepharisma stoltei]|uniref:Uncharacterized protein n=1 Tax=Blepharisma stoltei TaxID=1481888 RepID=A0AAU9JLN7_9CILI|nr:unnamed protein product [Blepharisma stoltei]
MRFTTEANFYGFISASLYVVILTTIGFFLTKIEWSTYIRLKYNETLLVMHGKEVEMIRQQPVNATGQQFYMVSS